MTEMLGVLAVIGVLSIGGIAGYTYAMERHYTNEILNAASQRAIVIASQIAAGRQVSLKEFDGQKKLPAERLTELLKNGMMNSVSR